MNGKVKYNHIERFFILERVNQRKDLAIMLFIYRVLT